MTVTGAAELYGLALSEFTGERDALVKRLRAEGRREDADLVAKRRRPPITAWALDQVARHHPQLIDDVLTAGARLRTSIEAPGRDTTGRQDAQTAERRAIEAAVEAAERYLGDVRHSVTPVQCTRMSATLRAAVLDESVAGELRAGTLDRDHDPPGFGLDVAAGTVSPPAVAGRTGGEADRRAARQRAARQAEVDKLTRRAQQLAAIADDAQQRAAQARARADQAAADAEAARRQLDREDPSSA
jgi:hypothetical protein